MWSTIQLTFHKTLTRYRLMKPFLGLMVRKEYVDNRMKPILRELLDLHNTALLGDIAAPTLVVGGAEDQVIPSQVMREMAELIPDSRLKLYAGYGHGNDVENPAYQDDVDEFASEISGRTSIGM